MKQLLLIFTVLIASCTQMSSETKEQIKIFVGPHHLMVEVAADEASQSRGLMFRKSLPENEGMLFDFGGPGIYSFWMKDTVIPLSIAFLNKEGMITKIEVMTPGDTTLFHRSPVGTRYGLEVNEGWFKRHQIQVGDEVILPA